METATIIGLVIASSYRRRNGHCDSRTQDHTSATVPGEDGSHGKSK
jgi:hypothetical protein